MKPATPVSHEGHGCWLDSLVGLASSEALPGLVATPDGLAISPTHFACCSGSSMRMDPRDTDHSSMRRCALGDRLKETRRLVRQRQTWLGASADSGQDGQGRDWASEALNRDLQCGTNLTPFLQRFAALASGRSQRGIAWSAGTLSPWAVALAAAWRFGMPVHIAILGRTPIAELLPPLRSAPRLICLAGIGGLWDIHTNEQLSSVITYAYSGMIPLFMEFKALPLPPLPQGKPAAAVAPRPGTAAAPTSQPAAADAEPAPPPTAGYGSTRNYFRQQLDGLRSRSPLSWLPPSTVAKALCVTDGLANMAAAAEREWAREAQGKSARRARHGTKQVPLPWEPKR